MSSFDLSAREIGQFWWYVSKMISIMQLWVKHRNPYYWWIVTWSAINWNQLTRGVVECDHRDDPAVMYSSGRLYSVSVHWHNCVVLVIVVALVCVYFDRLLHFWKAIREFWNVVSLIRHRFRNQSEKVFSVENRSFFIFRRVIFLFHLSFHLSFMRKINQFKF